MSGPVVNPASFGPRQAQPIDGFMSDAKSVLDGLFGKTDPKDLPPMARAAIEATQRIRGIAARTFAPGTEGEELLEAICDAVLRRPIFVTQLGIPSDQALAFGAFREGQAAAVYLLLAWIAEGRGEQSPQREGESHGTNTKKRTRKRHRLDDDAAVGAAPGAGAAGRRARSSGRGRQQRRSK